MFEIEKLVLSYNKPHQLSFATGSSTATIISYLLIPSSLILVDACGGFGTSKIVGITF